MATLTANLRFRLPLAALDLPLGGFVDVHELVRGVLETARVLRSEFVEPSGGKIGEQGFVLDESGRDRKFSLGHLEITAPWARRAIAVLADDRLFSVQAACYGIDVGTGSWVGRVVRHVRPMTGDWLMESHYVHATAPETFTTVLGALGGRFLDVVASVCAARAADSAYVSNDLMPSPEGAVLFPAEGTVAGAHWAVLVDELAQQRLADSGSALLDGDLFPKRRVGEKLLVSMSDDPRVVDQGRRQRWAALLAPICAKGG